MHLCLLIAVVAALQGSGRVAVADGVGRATTWVRDRLGITDDSAISRFHRWGVRMSDGVFNATQVMVEDISLWADGARASFGRAIRQAEDALTGSDPKKPETPPSPERKE